MTIVGLYFVEASEGRAEAMKRALVRTARVVRGSAGSEGIELLHDRTNENRFVIIERWESKFAHGVAAGQIPPTMLKAIQEVSGAPPDGSYYRSVSER